MVAVDAVGVPGGDSPRLEGPAVHTPRFGLRRGRRTRWGRGTFLLIVGVYFLLPIAAAFRFALQTNTGKFSFNAFAHIPSQQGFGPALWLSVRLAIVTTLIELALMIPTAVFVHLRAPGLRRLFDGLTLLPIAIPPVVLIIGVLPVAPTSLKGTPYLLALEYVILAMPFAYRSLDTGLRAIDLKTLVEASRSLGASWYNTLRRVLIPNLRSAVLGATLLTIALVLGEYTMANLDQYQTVPVWIVAFDQNDGHVSVAVSLCALVITWLVLLAIAVLAGRPRRARRQRPTTRPAPSPDTASPGTAPATAR